MLNKNRILITTAPGKETIALNELHSIGLAGGVRLGPRIAPGVFVVDIEASAEALQAGYREKPPLFIRHRFPVVLEGLAEEVLFQINSLPIARGEAFSVQTRSFHEGSFSREINRQLSEALVRQGYEMDIRYPRQVVSLVIDPLGKAYAGISSPEENLSRWAGGMPKYENDPAAISRAERKLMEAIEVFKLPFEKGQSALDLGAAPGGWSRILAAYGLTVTAVDPASLAPALTGRVQHVKETAQRFFSKAQGCVWHVITNDMKMDVNESIDMMIAAKPFMAPGGWGLITLKLQEKNQQKQAERAVGILKKHFHVIGARQLFHNRSEVTAAVSAPDL